MLRSRRCGRWRGLVPALGMLLLAANARADGIPAYYDSTGLHLLAEASQEAFVALSDGEETLVLQVAVSAEGALEGAQKLAWITPIPAPVDQVRVDVIRGFPSLRGVRPSAYVASKLREVLGWLSVSQIYPTAGLLFRARGADEARGNVGIQKTVRRDGVEVELLSAGSIDALSRHLADKGVPLPPSALAALGSYVGSGHSFVLYRVADLGEYRRALAASSAWPPSLGVEVTFPSEEGFFPLVASAALPGPSIDITVTVLGHWMPSPGAPPGVTTDHFVGSLEASGELLARLGRGAPREEPYTRLSMQAAPRALTADLRFRPGAPALTRVTTALLTSGALSAVLFALGGVLFPALSAFSAIVARRAFPADRRPTAREAARLGLFNLFSVIGVIFAAFAMAKKLNAPKGAALRFTALFSVVFCAALLALARLVSTMG